MKHRLHFGLGNSLLDMWPALECRLCVHFPLSVLTFCPVWTCIGLFCDSLHECIYASVLLCLEASGSLESSIPSGPYSLSGGLFIKHLVLSWVFPSFSLSTHSPGVSLCINHHLLREAASLVRAGWCSDLWIKHCAIGSRFMAMFT